VPLGWWSRGDPAIDAILLLFRTTPAVACGPGFPSSSKEGNLLQVANLGSPRPSAEEGLGGEGDTFLLNQFQQPTSG
jgi:hypothetical protein